MTGCAYQCAQTLKFCFVIALEYSRNTGRRRVHYAALPREWQHHLVGLRLRQEPASHRQYKLGQISEHVTHPQWHTAKKEGPPFSFPTLDSQLLQIKQLPNRHSPPGKQPLVQEVAGILTRPSFKGGHVSRDCRELALPDPF